MNALKSIKIEMEKAQAEYMLAALAEEPFQNVFGAISELSPQLQKKPNEVETGQPLAINLTSDNWQVIARVLVKHPYKLVYQTLNKILTITGEAAQPKIKARPASKKPASEKN